MKIKKTDSFVVLQTQTLIYFARGRIFNYCETGLLRARKTYDGSIILGERWR